MRPSVDITVGDPEVADVDSAHRSGALDPRQEDRNHAGHRSTAKASGWSACSTSRCPTRSRRLSAELRRITGGGIRVSSVNGRIMLSGTSHDAATLDKAVVIARQFAPDIINTVQVLQPQQVMLEVRFIEAKRQAGRELGLQWNTFGKNTLDQYRLAGAGQPTARHPPGGPFQQPPLMTNDPAGQVGGKNILANQLPISPIVAAGVLSGRQRLRSASCSAP